MFRIIGAFVFSTLLCGCDSKPAVALGDTGPVIDVHMHALPPPHGPSPVSGVTAPATLDALKTSMLAEMDRHHVALAVVSGAWDDVVAWRQSAPNRFLIGPLLFHPPTLARASDPAVSVLRQAHRLGQLSVLGELANQYSGIAANDPLLEPYWDLAEELDVPVAIHTGSSAEGIVYSCCPDFRLRYGNPLLLDDVLAHHPRVRVYLMHAGEPWREETAAILDMYPQVYVDVAAIDWVGGAAGRPVFHEFLKWLIDRGYGSRVMFGSDGEWPDVIDLALQGINTATFLTPAQKRDILFNNAIRFFRLDPATIHSVR